ncbi:hypothetical protein ZOSMA_120G00100 [Zostera marina]|uniref:Uncharacterized protein n=1 Tax=Zostera marina TaxID=29655 RepID=A0A0K9Q375_ZOSMR|nr:hypothetical protein ZOSMA_120G00100 [Zostera marina]
MKKMRTLTKVSILMASLGVLAAGLAFLAEAMRYKGSDVPPLRYSDCKVWKHTGFKLGIISFVIFNIAHLMTLCLIGFRHRHHPVWFSDVIYYIAWCFYVANFFIYIFACKYEGGRPSKQQWEETKNCYTGKPALFAIAGGLGLVITAMDIFCYLHNILVSSPSETPSPTGDSRVSLNEKRSTDVVDV